MSVDHTHDASLRSWVPGADAHEAFPIQNLPIGVFQPPGESARGGIAIGDYILDLKRLLESGILANAELAEAAQPTLNRLLALGAPSRVALRHAVSALLAAGTEPRPGLLHKAAACVMHRPAVIGDYSDFFAGIHHATKAGTLFRPEDPLFPNYKWVPIGYHGRASSVRVSHDVHRPNGQRKPASEVAPSYGPSRNLDYELELGIWIGPGNAPGTTIPIGQAGAHIAGYCLLNDWSARDVQGWEYQPLGPFLAKSFCTTISPWIVTPEALAPFRAAQPARPEGDPAPLPYLFDADDQACGALGLSLDVLLLTAKMRNEGVPAHRVSVASALDLYWTPAQMVTHQASNGCDLSPGDLLGSGTISSPAADGSGSLLELTSGGRVPIALPNGEMRRFLEDGDEVILRATAQRDGFISIGFGDCFGRIVGAV
jgi:fumarylacetoacetase